MFVEQDDGGYLRAFCRYSDLFAADLAVSKHRKHPIDVYATEGLASRSRTTVDASMVLRANNDDCT